MFLYEELKLLEEDFIINFLGRQEALTKTSVFCTKKNLGSGILLPIKQSVPDYRLVIANAIVITNQKKVFVLVFNRMTVMC